MTKTKQLLILPVLAALISVLAFSAQDAAALTFTVNDKISCESPAVGGTWNSITSTCAVATLVIGPTDTLVIASNVNFNIGTITSSGVIVNNGTINIASGGVITTSGTFINNGVIDNVSGTITNSGPFNNFGELTSSGTITNGPTGVIQNRGHMTSTGVITSSGAIQTNWGSVLISSGTFTNSLNLVNNGSIMTSGTFTNSGPVMNIGDILNQGLFTNSNTITNWGGIFNLCGGSITNSGTIAVRTVIDICAA
ncbi:transporter [Nitrosopumilus sp.]|uniref:transporter n=1 Tax=Nitrosopumilus sp. TaxID=2024843 RepID=UPI0034A03D52